MFCTSTGHGHRFTVHRVVCHGGESEPGEEEEEEEEGLLTNNE